MRALFAIILLTALVFPSGHASASPSIDISAEELQTLRRQAAQGDAFAQTNLGLQYVAGLGVPRDYAKARQWLEQAAAQGETEAQFNLGVLYAMGHGVSRDYVRAYMWWRLAAAHMTGDDQKQAEENRDGVARRMTPTQIAEAQRLSQQCEARQFKGC